MALLARGPEVTVQLGCEGIPWLSKGHPEEATFLLDFGTGSHWVALAVLRLSEICLSLPLDDWD